jgi:hypothetical protein
MHRRCQSRAVEAAGTMALAFVPKAITQGLARDLPETALRATSRHPTTQPSAVNRPGIPGGSDS